MAHNTIGMPLHPQGWEGCRGEVGEIDKYGGMTNDCSSDKR